MTQPASSPNRASQVARWTERFQSRMRWGSFLERLGEYMAGFLLVFGSLILLSRLAIPAMWPHVMWVGLVAPIVIGFAWWKSAESACDAQDAAALLDQKLDAGGLLMSVGETDPNGWESELTTAEARYRQAMPKVRPTRLLKLTVVPLLFAVCTGFVPLKEPDLPRELRQTVAQKELDSLSSMLEVLKEEEVIEKKEAERIEEQIQDLKEKTRTSPLTHEQWEVADTLRERMRKRVDQAEMKLSRALAATISLQKAENEDAPSLSVMEGEELSDDIVEALKKFQKDQDDFDGLKKLVKKDRDAEDKKGRVSQQNRSKLSLPEDAEKRKEALEQLSKFLQQEGRDIESLRMLLGMTGENGEPMPGDEGQGQGGQGGTEQGDDSPSWLGMTGDTEEEGSKFKEVILPPGYLDEPGKKTVAITATTPAETTDDAEVSPRTADRGTERAFGGETTRRAPRPSHQKVIREYFGDE